MQDILQKLAPKSLDIILEAYIKTWESASEGKDHKTPHITFFLDINQKIKGELIHIDFEESMLSMRLDEDHQHLQVAFIYFRGIKHFILHELENYPNFIEELDKL
ncbi:MAG: hypothetical protein NW226_12625 [Microscillaceae bacterium]|nr:hypothetical protein [Microscillaceae bacterium]